MIRHLNILFNFYSFWFKKSIGRNTQVFIQSRKTNSIYGGQLSSALFKKKCFIDAKSFFLHALL
ncbi:hypothetical protein EW15_1395 [Prochlorococcus sp. MIT 0801]|nr:hypothetical protein EW15_1395 [Prochlorococcus sp. MIT 0801]